MTLGVGSVGGTIPSICAVDAHFINLGRVLAEILDVAQDVAAAVLADEVAQVGAQSHVCDARLVIAPFLDGETLEENEALSIDDVLAESFQVLRKLRENEVGLDRQ